MSEDINKRLSRWSERKLAARRGEPVEDGADKPELSKTPAATDAAEEAAPVLPSIDELTAESDYTVFLGRDVPAALKKAALRKLWSSNPFFNIRDGLDDYDEDFNALLTPITPGQTSYKIGKGYMDEVEKAVAKLEPANDAGDKRLPETPPAAATSVGENGEDGEPVPGKSDAGGDKPAALSQQAGINAPDKISGGQAED